MAAAIPGVVTFLPHVSARILALSLAVALLASVVLPPGADDADVDAGSAWNYDPDPAARDRGPPGLGRQPPPGIVDELLHYPGEAAAALEPIVSPRGWPPIQGKTANSPGFSSPSTMPGATGRGEPGLRVDRRAALAEVDRVFVHSFETAWRSLDGGSTFELIDDPLTTVVSGDADMALGWPGGPFAHRAYKIDLSLACQTLTWSDDGGEAWLRDDADCGLPGQDRQWIETGPNRLPQAGLVPGQEALYLAVNQVPSGLIVAKAVPSATGGVPHFAQVAHVAAAHPPLGTCWRGNVAVDPNDGTVYVIECIGSSTLTRLGVFTSRDGGLTWDRYEIPGSTTNTILFPVVTTDRAGNVYAAWTSAFDADVYFSASRDQARTWSAPLKINGAPGGTVFPWIRAGDAGRVDIAYLGTARDVHPDDAKFTLNSGPGDIWHLYMAQSLNALAAAPTFTEQRAADDPVQVGRICTQGADCVSARNLGDFLQIDYDSKGRAVIAFADGCADPCANLRRQSGDSLTKVVQQVEGDGLLVPAPPTHGLEVLGPADEGPRPQGPVDVFGVVKRPLPGPVPRAAPFGLADTLQLVDPAGDVTVARLPIDEMDLRAAWFENDAHYLYVGLGIEDLPQTPPAQQIAYGVSFKPAWTSSFPKPAGAFEGLRVLAVLSVADGHAGGVPTLSDGRTHYELQSLAGGSFLKLADLPASSIHPDRDILWFVVPRALLKDPPAGAVLHSPGAIAVPAVEGAATAGTGFGDTATSSSSNAYSFRLPAPERVEVYVDAEAWPRLMLPLDSLTQGRADWAATVPDSEAWVGTHALSVRWYDADGDAPLGQHDLTMEIVPPDSTPPDLSLPAEVAVVASSSQGNRVTYETSATDDVSGELDPACAPASGSVFPLGATLVACTVADAAGNMATSSFTVRVEYAWSGLQAPIDAEEADEFNRRQSVPLKFALRDASADITDAVGRLWVDRVVDASGSIQRVEATEFPAQGSRFEYDPEERHYLLVVSLGGLAAGDYLFRVDLGDGQDLPEAFTVGE